MGKVGLARAKVEVVSAAEEGESRMGVKGSCGGRVPLVVVSLEGGGFSFEVRDRLGASTQYFIEK